MTEPTEIFVMSINNGCEGHSPSIQAFLHEKDARAAKALLDAAGYYSVDVHAVPVWPAPAISWMHQKPIDPEKPLAA